MKPIKQSGCWGCFCRNGVPRSKSSPRPSASLRSLEMGPQDQFQAIKDAGLDIAIFVGTRPRRRDEQARETTPASRTRCSPRWRPREV